MNCMHVPKKIIILILFLSLAKPCFSAPVDRNNTMHTVLTLISKICDAPSQQRDVFSYRFQERVDELIQIGLHYNLDDAYFQTMLEVLMPQLILWGVAHCKFNVDWVLTSIFRNLAFSVQQAVMMPVPAQAPPAGNMPFPLSPHYPAAPVGGSFGMAPMLPQHAFQHSPHPMAPMPPYPAPLPPQMFPATTRPVIDAHHVHRPPPPPPRGTINSPSIRLQGSEEAAPVEHSGQYDSSQVNNKDNGQSATPIVENDRSKSTEGNEGQRLVSDASPLTGKAQHSPVSSSDLSSVTENEWPSLAGLRSETDVVTPVNSDSTKNKEIEDSDQSINTKEPSESVKLESVKLESVKLKEEVSPVSKNTQETQTEESLMRDLDTKKQEIQSRIKVLQASQSDIQKKMEEASEESRLTQQRLKEELKISENKQKTLKKQLDEFQNSLQTEKEKQRTVKNQLEEEKVRNTALKEEQAKNEKNLQSLKKELTKVRQNLQEEQRRQQARNQAKKEEEEKLAEILKKKQNELDKETQSLGENLAEAQQDTRTERERREKAERQAERNADKRKELENKQKAFEKRNKALAQKVFENSQYLEQEKKKREETEAKVTKERAKVQEEQRKKKQAEARAAKNKADSDQKKEMYKQLEQIREQQEDLKHKLKEANEKLQAANTARTDALTRTTTGGDFKPGLSGDKVPGTPPAMPDINAAFKGWNNMQAVLDAGMGALLQNKPAVITAAVLVGLTSIIFGGGYYWLWREEKTPDSEIEPLSLSDEKSDNKKKKKRKEKVIKKQESNNSSCHAIVDIDLKYICFETKGEHLPLLALLDHAQREYKVVNYQKMNFLLQSAPDNPGLTPSRSQPDDQQSVLLGINEVGFDYLSFIEKREISAQLAAILYPKMRLSDKIRHIVYFGKLCAGVPSRFRPSCLSYFQDIKRKNLMEDGIAELSFLPQREVSFSAMVKQPNQFVLAPTWTLSSESRLAEPGITMLRKEGNRASQKDGVENFTFTVPESGYYYLQKYDISHYTFESRRNVTPVYYLAGEKVEIKPDCDEGYRFGKIDMPYAAVIFNQSSVHSQFAWRPDHGFNNEVNQIYHAVMSGWSIPSGLSDSFDRWKGRCPAPCLFPEFELHGQDGSLITSADAFDKPGEDLIFNFVPNSRFIKLSDIKQGKMDDWKSLLLFVYSSEHLRDFDHFATMSRQYCGMFVEPANTHFQLACLLQLADSLNQKSDWMKEQEFIWFSQSYPDGDQGDTPELAASIIWPAYGRYSLGTPRFIPALRSDEGLEFITKNSRKIKRSIKLAAGDYGIYRLGDDYSLERGEDLHINGKSVVTVSSGSHILIDRNNPLKRWFILHRHDHAYFADPIPAYHTQALLYLPMDIYPLDRKKKSWWEDGLSPDLGVKPTINCQVVSAVDSYFKVCSALVASGDLEDAFTFLLVIAKEYSKFIYLPSFSLDNKEVAFGQFPKEDVEGEEEITNYLKSLNPSTSKVTAPYILRPSTVMLMQTVPGRHLVELVRDYSSAMTRHKVRNGRSWVLFMLLTHCGRLGKQLRHQCADSMIQYLLTRPYEEEAPLLTAYLKSLEPHLNSQTKISVILVNWYFDAQLNLSDQPSYAMYIRTTENLDTIFTPFTTDDLLYPMELTGLEPNRTYKLWVHDLTLGHWLAVPQFKISTGSHQTTRIEYLPINSTLGLSLSHEDSPSSFHYFRLEQISQRRAINLMVLGKAMRGMYPPLWKQKIAIKPAP